MAILQWQRTSSLSSAWYLLQWMLRVCKYRCICKSDYMPLRLWQNLTSSPAAAEYLLQWMFWGCVCWYLCVCKYIALKLRQQMKYFSVVCIVLVIMGVVSICAWVSWVFMYGCCGCWCVSKICVWIYAPSQVATNEILLRRLHSTCYNGWCECLCMGIVSVHVWVLRAFMYRCWHV